MPYFRLTYFMKADISVDFGDGCLHNSTGASDFTSSAIFDEIFRCVVAVTSHLPDPTKTDVRFLLMVVVGS